MSRIGRKPIALPGGVQVAIEGSRVEVKGPRGQLSTSIHPDMRVEQRDNALHVIRPSDNRLHRSIHGLSRTLVANMVEGVTTGFRKELELQGVGYRVQKTGDGITLLLGFSHPVEVTPPAGITFEVQGNNRLIISGIDKQLVGETAARVRRVRPPEPYKGKGVRYAGERVRLKSTRAAKSSAR